MRFITRVHDSKVHRTRVFSKNYKALNAADTPFLITKVFIMLAF